MCTIHQESLRYSFQADIVRIDLEPSVQVIIAWGLYECHRPAGSNAAKVSIVNSFLYDSEECTSDESVRVFVQCPHTHVYLSVAVVSVLVRGIYFSSTIATTLMGSIYVSSE